MLDNNGNMSIPTYGEKANSLIIEQWMDFKEQLNPKWHIYDKWSKRCSDRFLQLLSEAFDTRYYDLCNVDNIADRYTDLTDRLYSGTYSRRFVAITRQIDAFRSKNVDIDLGIDREAAALNTFLESEVRCKQMNAYYEENQTFAKCERDEAALLLARRKISDILGDVPSLNTLDLKFGPGASSSVSSKITNPRNKLDVVPTISKAAHTHLHEIWETCPLYAYAHKGRARIAGGILAFVPKNAKTDRTTLWEPLLNTYVQKGIGKFIKDKFLENMNGRKKAPINLRDASINRSRARQGSISGETATIDLKSASDLISSAVVLDLFPLPWVEFLSKWRTEIVFIPKIQKKLVLNKFSTMGNGFTFELQSIIFYSLAYGVAIRNNVKPDITVFGDDIICPSSIYEDVCELLTTLGMEVNVKKSYATGPFRESCGGDYYEGTNIRPFYIRDRMEYSTLFQMINYWKFSDIVPLWLRHVLINLIPEHVILFGPCGFGDGHIHVYDHISYEPHDRKHGLSTFKFKTWHEKPCRERLLPKEKGKKRKAIDRPIGDYLLPFYMVSEVVAEDPMIYQTSYLRFNKTNRSYKATKIKDTCVDPFAIRGSRGRKKSTILFMSAEINSFYEQLSSIDSSL